MMKHWKRNLRNGVRIGLFGATLAAGALASSDSASAADKCISAAAETALSECPAGVPQQGAAKRPDVPHFQAPPPVNLKKNIDDTKPTNPSEQMNAAQRDLRRASMEVKSRQLLVTEIQGLESLFHDTKKNSPDRPKLARRLAEGYVELENAAFRDATESDIKADDAKKRNDASAASSAADSAKSARQVLDLARQSAIKYYSLMTKDYKDWCQQPNDADPSKSTGCGDEVLYYLAFEYEQAKDLEKARTVYQQLISDWPQSKYIPNAYLAFGEVFFAQAQTDPSQWSFAEQSYGQVIKYPAPDNKVFGYAHYKLAYVFWNQGEYGKAMTEFKNVIDYGSKFSQLPNATQLQTSARRDIIPVYALSGDPKKAYGFLHPLSGDDGNSNDKTYKMMDDLGLNYLDTGHYQEGIDLYTDLKSKDKGPRVCEYQGHITEATLAMKSSDKQAIVNQLNNQVAMFKEYNKGSYPADAKQKCGNITADLESETAMAWHLEAVGTNGIRGTSDPKTMKLAADVYENVVQNFTQSDFNSYTFPRIVKEDWPNIMKIKYAMADLLYFQKDWKRCGPAFDSVVAEDPKGSQAAEAAFASVLCYQNIYQESHKDGSDRKTSGNLPGSEDDKKKGKATPADNSKFQPVAFDENQKGMITAFNRYVCYIKPDANGEKTAKTQYAEVKYARAHTYFETKHYEEAALGFRDVAMSNSDEDVGIFAAQLYLESLNIIGTHSEPSRPQCFESMADDVPQFVKLYCEGGKKSQNEEQCGILLRIQRDIERLAAQKIFERAGEHVGTAESLEEYRTAGQRYLDLWEKYGKEPCEKGQKEACARNDEVLANAAEAFQAARLIMKAVSVRQKLISKTYHLNETDLARRAVYKIGANYQAIAVYEKAAEYYEQFADENPKMDEKDASASTALSDATVLRLGLGQEDQAIKDADLFNRNYGAKKSAEAAQVAFAIGAHYADKEDWGNARKHLADSLRQIDANAATDVKIQAHALMGQVYVKLGNNTQARSEYDGVRKSWASPDQMVAKISAEGKNDSDDVKQRKLGKVLTAVGEAYFFFAEEKRAAVDKIVFPVYKGSGDRADVLNFVKTKVTDWIGKKKPAIDEADKEYQKILGLQPLPPPRWVIAAGSRVGQMKGKFVAEFRAAPIPKEWTQNGPSNIPDLNWEDLRGNYYDSLDAASEPIKQEAKAAFKTCLDLSVKYQYFDEYSRTCEKWLSKNYPKDYHLIDEFRSAPTRVGSGLNERPQMLNPDNSPVVDTPAAPPPAPASGGSDPAKSSDKPAATVATPAPANKNDDPLANAKRK